MSSADELQRQARAILRDARFHERRTPGPFRGVFRRLGDWLEPALGPLGRLLGRGFRVVGDWWAAPETRIALVLGVILFAALLATAVIRRRTAVALGGRRQDRVEDDDPRALERGADQAQSEGRFDDAVRLRFQAGVVRLQRDGRLRRGRSTPTRAIARQLRLDEFDRLGRTFDAVAYGGQPASDQDATDAKRDWERVLVEVARRQ